MSSVVVNNQCIVCKIDMGESNPRQLCGKTYCTNDPYKHDDSDTEVDIPESNTAMLVPTIYTEVQMEKIYLSTSQKYTFDRMIIFEKRTSQKHKFKRFWETNTPTVKTTETTTEKTKTMTTKYTTETKKTQTKEIKTTETETTVSIIDYNQIGLSEDVIQSVGIEQLIHWSVTTGKPMYLRLHRSISKFEEQEPLV